MERWLCKHCLKESETERNQCPSLLENRRTAQSSSKLNDGKSIQPGVFRNFIKFYSDLIFNTLMRTGNDRADLKFYISQRKPKSQKNFYQLEIRIGFITSKPDAKIKDAKQKMKNFNTQLILHALIRSPLNTFVVVFF